MKYIRVTMPNGSKWDIPARFIAEERAKYYVESDFKKEGKSLSAIEYNNKINEEIEYALNEDDSGYELYDWLSNNMNWKDIKNIAKKVIERPTLTEEDLQEGIINGEKEIIEK